MFLYGFRERVGIEGGKNGFSSFYSCNGLLKSFDIKELGLSLQKLFVNWLVLFLPEKEREFDCSSAAFYI
jgi:hypothetical protein